MTRFTFFKTLVTSVLLDGNGYAYIERDSVGNAVQLSLPAFVHGEYCLCTRSRYRYTAKAISGNWVYRIGGTA